LKSGSLKLQELSGPVQASNGIALPFIVVNGRSFIQHDNKLKEVVARLRKYRLKLQPEKCEFLRKEVNYLGRIVTEAGVTAEPSKIKLVLEFTPPTNVTTLKRFLGMAGYCRLFIPEFSRLASLLHKLLGRVLNLSGQKTRKTLFRL
jgi:hypothetical protein